ncbi:MAG TPA: PspC domain-containing protein [Propionibacteriaceae bacterium]|nr:PspC domain-containing protein [Propionibacteriaceae bacterium]
MPDSLSTGAGAQEPAPRPSLAEIAAQLDAQAAAETSPAATPEPARQRKATRVPTGAWLGGVCTGLAAHLGWPVLLIRAIVVALAGVELVGAVMYAVLWLAMPIDRSPAAPGIDAATRTGMRSESTLRSSDIGERFALLLLGVGVALLVQFLVPSLQMVPFWPMVVFAVGVALVWRQADSLVPRIGRRRRMRGVVQALLGIALIAGGIVLTVARGFGVQQLTAAQWVGVLLFVVLLAVAAPWAFRTRTALTAAREQELLANARADVASHLHDSVLQTLALIQRQADDPKAVAALARKQERELRQWLYGESRKADTLKAALEAAAAEVEDDRGVTVDLVVVGDHDMDVRMDALVRASREAMLNAAKHSGADRVDVYAEIGEDVAEVYIRDRGQGFEVGSVSDDRMGVRGSIVDRMARHDGTARIRSAPGEGTEVWLRMELE